MLFKDIFLKRWLDWTITIIVVVFILLMWAIQTYSIEQDYSFSGNDIYYSIKLHNKTQQQNTIDASTWKMYRNFGFEFRYPSDWRIDEDTNGLKVINTSMENIPSDNAHLPSGDSFISLHHIQKPAILSIAEFAQTNAGSNIIVQTKTVTLVNRSAYQLTLHTLDDPSIEKVFTYVSNNGADVVVISVLFNADAPNRDEILARYNVLLASFSLMSQQ
ncbi:MAG: PsbP-related protein [Patescibacteria group bacterium]